MSGRLLDLPFLVILVGLGAAAMLLPAVHAAAVADHATARSFFYSGLLFLVLFAFIAIATSNRPVRQQGRNHLLALVAAYTVLPVMLAVPFHDAVAPTRFLNAYIEMVSAFTTTGATLYEPARLPASVHLWRAQVGWMGGFFVWVTAVSVLAPLNLGGFEVRASRGLGQGAAAITQIARVANTAERLRRFTLQLLPVYLGLTAILWFGLVFAGDSPLVALCHAMSTLATSGISPIGGLEGASSGLPGEALILLFLALALTRLTYAREERPEGWRSIPADPEFRLGLSIVGAVAVLLFLRQWSGAFDRAGERDVTTGLEALWGNLFTVSSFLTTTGFVSSDWDVARIWSGLEAPGLILMGLAVFGGGVGTTAGGVKLLRVYTLYIHGRREIDRLIHPSSIGGSGPVARQLRRQGAAVAWIFFMLFALSIVLVMSALSLTGLGFEASLVLTIAALSTTGPLVEVAGGAALRLDLLSDAAKVIFAAGMVIGRLETLVLVALLNPEFWRR
jgi:trk system potassium uptake protein TrkH